MSPYFLVEKDLQETVGIIKYKVGLQEVNCIPEKPKLGSHYRTEFQKPPLSLPQPLLSLPISTKNCID